MRAASRWSVVEAVALAVIACVAIVTRLHGLGTPADLDGYDEGVYWQSLRALHAGYRLYADIFCSQPPAFLEAVYPFYAALGGTIWAARAGIAALSLLGLVGACLLGRALSGRCGGVAGAGLLAAAPLYLQQSRRLEAEGPATAMLVVTVAAALLWRAHTSLRGRMPWAVVCGIGVSLGIAIKLLNVTALVPALMLAAAAMWQSRRRGKGFDRSLFLSLAAAVVACCLTTLLVVYPTLGAWPALRDQVWTFHIAARAAFGPSEAGNFGRLESFVLANAPLVVAALAGACVGAWRRDDRVMPLGAWLLATVILLAQQVPMFPRHAVALLPPLVALAALGLRPAGPAGRRWGGPVLVGLLCLAAVGSGFRAIATGRDAAPPPPPAAARMAEDVRRLTTPGRWIMTDAQFLAALADRDVPPALVDTSNVRIESGYLSAAQLIAAAGNPRVEAVLFATGRLTHPQLAPFRDWMAAHFRPLRRYGESTALWVRQRP